MLYEIEKAGPGGLLFGEVFMHLALHTKRAKVILWLSVLMILLIAIYAYTHRSAGGARKVSARPLVKVERMERKDMMKRVVLSGETVPKASVDISPKYAGRLEKVYVDLGDRVEKGDILVSPGYEGYYPFHCPEPGRQRGSSGGCSGKPVFL